MMDIGVSIRVTGEHNGGAGVYVSPPEVVTPLLGLTETGDYVQLSGLQDGGSRIVLFGRIET